MCRHQGGYIFYAGASLAGAGYCRQCRHLTTPTVAGLPGLCENFRPTTSKSSPILRLLSSHWATSVVRTRVVGVASVGDSLRRLSSLQHGIYRPNLLGTVSLFARAPLPQSFTDLPFADQHTDVSGFSPSSVVPVTPPPEPVAASRPSGLGPTFNPPGGARSTSLVREIR